MILIKCYFKCLSYIFSFTIQNVYFKDVLDLISGGSRSSTPAQPNAAVFNGQRNSPTFDQSVQTGNQQSPGNGRGGRNQRNRSTSSSDTRKQIRQQG